MMQRISLHTTLLLGFILAWLAPLTGAEKIVTLSSAIYRTAEMPFEVFDNPGPFGKAILQNVPFEPVKKLGEQVAAHLGLGELRQRGEAHITILTPPEFLAFEPYVSLNELNILARRYRIQQTRFQVLCLGSGRKELEGKNEETFFLVVRGKELLRLREKFHEYARKKGMPEGRFDPFDFYPHITVGFTKKDLHIQDGVKKDESSRDPRFQLKVTRK